MTPFHYRNHELFCEEIPVSELAGRYGTPLYLYSQTAILDALSSLQTAFADVDPLICYSVKANSNLGILRVMAEHGSGFDVVSAGELYRVGLAGGAAAKTVFAGVGKTDLEIAAGLEAGVLMFNVESEAELEAMTRVAAAPPANPTR
jgi:diaminopimelate decarboxylase